LFLLNGGVVVGWRRRRRGALFIAGVAGRGGRGKEGDGRRKGEVVAG
jgi:hypothetical protein